MGKQKTETGESQETQTEEQENPLGLELPLDQKSSSKESSVFKDQEETEETSDAEKTKKKKAKETEESEEKETFEESESEETEEESQDEETTEEESEETEEDEPTPEEIAKFTPREKGLYNAVKKERKARQKIETELDYIKLQTKYNQKPITEKTEKTENEEELTDPLQELFDSKGPDDFITAAELGAALKKQREQENKVKSKKTEKETAFENRKREVQEQTDAAEKIMQGRYRDYSEAAHYGQQMLERHPTLLQEFLDLSFNKSPIKAVEWLYNLGKDHRDFGTGKFGKTSKEQKEREKVKKVIVNSDKKKTSAGDTGDKTPARFTTDELENMDPEELGRTLAAMPENEYFKLPRKIRKRALQAAQ